MEMSQCSGLPPYPGVRLSTRSNGLEVAAVRCTTRTPCRSVIRAGGQHAIAAGGNRADQSRKPHRASARIGLLRSRLVSS
jgi:hypothetical protein